MAKYGVIDVAKYGVVDVAKCGVVNVAKYGVIDVAKCGVIDEAKYGVVDVAKDGPTGMTNMSPIQKWALSIETPNTGSHKSSHCVACVQKTCSAAACSAAAVTPKLMQSPQALCATHGALSCKSNTSQ